jgi:inner membrane protein
MDSLTQVVLGAAVGEAVLGKKAGNKAMLYGAIAGTIPDLDIIAGYFTDTIRMLEIHRGFSHSIVFFILFSPLAGWVISKIERGIGATWREWSFLMFMGLFTHSWLDAHTSWGTQMFWPLEYRVAFKNIFVIDPLYTLPFLVFVILAMRSKKGSKARRRYNILGLIISSCYMLLTVGLKGSTYFTFKDALNAQRIAYQEIQTRPSPLNAILWSANVATADTFLTADYSLFDTQPITFKAYPKNHHLLGDKIHDINVQRLIRITNGWFTIAEQEGKLYFNDLRFGTLGNGEGPARFAFSYILTEVDGLMMATPAPKDREDARKLMHALWERIWGN